MQTQLSRASAWANSHKLMLWTVVLYFSLVVAALKWGGSAPSWSPGQSFPGSD